MSAKLQQRNIGIPFLSKNIHLKMDKKRKERNGGLLAVIGWEWWRYVFIQSEVNPEQVCFTRFPALSAGCMISSFDLSTPALIGLGTN